MANAQDMECLDHAMDVLSRLDMRDRVSCLLLSIIDHDSRRVQALGAILGAVGILSDQMNDDERRAVADELRQMANEVTASRALQ